MEDYTAEASELGVSTKMYYTVRECAPPSTHYP